jgi:hypothetical protein
LLWSESSRGRLRETASAFGEQRIYASGNAIMFRWLPNVPK